jgi:hypothetical protein
MHSVGSAISAQNAKAKLDQAHDEAMGNRFETQLDAREQQHKTAYDASLTPTYQLPWGFKIEPSNDERWTHTMTCNNNFVFNGSLSECFIALGGHLNSLR